jgi:hypothetical protein
MLLLPMQLVAAGACVVDKMEVVRSCSLLLGQGAEKGEGGMQKHGETGITGRAGSWSSSRLRRIAMDGA